MPYDLMSTPCDQCLMTDRKIVSNARRRQIVKETIQKDCHFVCHKGSIAGRDIACKGHHDATGGGKLARFAAWAGIVQLIDPKTLEPIERVRADG